MRRMRTITCFVVFLAALAAPCRAQEGREPGKDNQLTPERAIARHVISDLRFSPDGERVAFTVSEPPQGTSRARHIWMLNVRSREVTRFTNSAKSESAPRWSPDGRRLAFLSNREETQQIYVLRADGGEAARVTEGKNAVQAFEWSPDGKQIAFLAPEVKTEAEEKKEKEKDDARVVDRDDKHAQLWILGVETHKARQLTSGRWKISEAQWLPGGDRLVVRTRARPH